MYPPQHHLPSPQLMEKITNVKPERFYKASDKNIMSEMDKYKVDRSDLGISHNL